MLMPAIEMPFVLYADTEKFIIRPSHSTDKCSRINKKLFVIGDGSGKVNGVAD